MLHAQEVSGESEVIPAVEVGAGTGLFSGTLVTGEHSGQDCKGGLRIPAAVDAFGQSVDVIH